MSAVFSSRVQSRVGQRSLQQKTSSVQPVVSSVRHRCPSIGVMGLMEASTTSTSQATTFQRAPDSDKSSPLLTKISAAVEVDASLAKFESFAGRYAMLGVLCVLVGELRTQTSVLNLTLEEGQSYLNVALMVVAFSALLASTLARGPTRLGSLLLPDVIAALTGRRSPCNTLGKDHDEDALGLAVDRVLSTTDLTAFLTASTEEEQ